MMMRNHSFGLLQLSLLNPRAYALVGAPIAVVVVSLYGLPTHAAITGVAMTVAAGFGITLGLHRLFAHRSFATARPVEWLLMVLGCMAGQTSPFFWIATHRIHHRHSDRSGDPHSPHITWCVICLMERLGLAWRVRRPRTADGGANLAPSSEHKPPTRAYRPARGEAN